MRQAIIEALQAHAKGHIEKHKANVEVLLEKTAGIAEHPDTLETIEKELNAFEIGKANVVTEYESKIVILNFGALLEEAYSVAKDLQITLIDMRFVKPLDEELLKKYLR